jgi:uncharacterized protein (DUF302 family)
MNKKILFLLSVVFLILSEIAGAQETTIYNSPFSFEETSRKIEDTLLKNGFDANATLKRENRVEIDGKTVNTVVFEFSDDAINKAIIECEPTAALDIPFKLVVWNEEGEVFIGYVDAMWLRRRFLIRDCNDQLTQYGKVLLRIVNETIRQN